MSTLVAQTISNGTVSTSSANVIQGSAKAWVNFNGANGSIRASYNVGSVTRNSTGNYSVNFTTAMPDANYCAVVSIEERGILCQTATADVFQQTAGVGRIGVTLGTTNTGFDAEQVNYTIFR